MSVGGWVGFVVAVIVVGGGLLLLRRDKLNKARGLATAVDARGWAYQHEQTDFQSRLARATLAVGLRSGNLNQSQHMISGEHRGRRFRAYEHVHRFRGSGEGSMDNDSTRQHVSVITPVRPGDMLLAARRNGGMLSKLMDMIGRSDVERMPEVEFANSAFSATFRVRADDAERARATFTGDVQNWLLQDGHAVDWPIVFRDGLVSAHRDGQLDLDDVVARLDFLVDLLERVPDAAWSTAPDVR